MTPYSDYLLHDFEERRQDRYAVVVFLPRHLDEMIVPLREKYDPIYNLVASHITLVFPFESTMPLDELTGIIKAETERQPSLLIELNSIGDFYPRFPVIYWYVKENAHLTRLYFRLYSRLGLPVPHKHFLPHVTVAREISNHRVMLVKEKIVSYLPSEKFFAQKVDLITSLSGNRWVSVRTFPLNGLERSSAL